MPSRDVCKRQLELHGATQRQRVIDCAENDIAKNVVSSPSYKTVLINDVEMALVINSTKKPNEKTLNTLPDGIVNIGDIVLWNEMHWLILEVDFDDEITRSGRMVQCNRIIKWQNPVTKETISRWCLATKPYTSNIEDGKIIATSNREYKIQLPYDIETQLIDLDKRFLLEKINGKAKAYKVTSVDTLTNRYEDIEGGFLIWNLTQTESNDSTDNTELMIADYIPPDSPTPPVEPDPTLLHCEVTGSSVIKIGGSARSYKGIFYLADGVTIDETVQAIWAVNIDAVLADKIISTPNGNSIDIACIDDVSMEDVSFTLQLSDTDGKYVPNEITIRVVAPI